ncbi:MAG TPA: helix-turn-helix domain-containing protein [Yinghuangia sp.]|uniref:helix-turn-helix transcriptional regulator n=1 Tax=Yinghuangia sp. YIM S10712 TaxID=3436930 RepID=UPI002C09FD9C|nr:helix-turn-helix domain-containing protein [Yinghuangia sp.]
MNESIHPQPRWTFLTNHSRVLATVARDPSIRVRDIAAACLLTERAVGAILSDLEEAGYLTRTREGRRNVYKVTPGTALRHPTDGGRPIADVLDLPSAAGPGHNSHTST